MKQKTLITLLGPTAVGKTKLASALAYTLDAEIISADSRQVFRRMDIGTGKDLTDYSWQGNLIKYHLVDVAEPGEEFSVFRFRSEFEKAFDDIISRNKMPLMCGGTGLYLDSVLSGYVLQPVEEDNEFRKVAEMRSDESLIDELKLLVPLHNKTDIEDRQRLIRAIEIARAGKQKTDKPVSPRFDVVLGLRFDRSEIRRRISTRLQDRLQNGMIDEVQSLIKEGISTDRLLFYGLEYKYVALYLIGKLTYTEMYSLLETAIHQFAKRQMTWFRRMERKGTEIFWLEGENGTEGNLKTACEFIKSKKNIEHLLK